MLKFKFLPLLGALAGFALVAGGSDFARADVVENFGATAPSNFSSCSFVTNDEGFVCPSSATYTTTNNDVLTATGYTGVFATTANITWKPSITTSGPPANSFDESGLGQNTAAPFTGGTANKCDDNPGPGFASTPCEVGVGSSLEVTSSLYAITDISVGSVQESSTTSAEVFGLYASTSSGALTSGNLLGTFSSAGGTVGGVTSQACSSFPGGSYDGSGLCTFNFSASLDYLSVGIVELTGLNSMASDSLITAVSVAPAPPIGQGLPVLLAVGGLLFGARLWGRSKKHRALGADTPLAAA